MRFESYIDISTLIIQGVPHEDCLIGFTPRVHVYTHA